MSVVARRITGLHTSSPSCQSGRIHPCQLSPIFQCEHNAIRPLRVGFYCVNGGKQTCEPRPCTHVTVHASSRHGIQPPKSHTRGSPSCLGLVLLPAPSKAVVLVLVRIWSCAKQGVREVHSTARAAAVSPNDRAAWDDADNNLLVSSVFLLQRMFSGFGFVGNMHNDRCGLDSPSNSPVLNHGATSVPSMFHFLENRFYNSASTIWYHMF